MQPNDTDSGISSPGDGRAIIARGLYRSFGATQALADIDLRIGKGTIHALVGENGAGKSTLLGILAGRIPPTAGDVQVFGRSLQFGDPRASRQLGIVAIYQELTIVPSLTAYDNVFLGASKRRGILFANDSAMRARFKELRSLVGTSIDPDSKAAALSVADQQLLEIMRAVEADARTILFDEPTASLAAAEREALFRLMRDLRGRGVTMVFVSHNLQEVLDLADHVTVFRDGRLVESREASAWNEKSLVGAMLGQDLQASTSDLGRSHASSHTGSPAICATEISLPGVLTSVDLKVSTGEVLGVAGLVGSGRTSLLRCLAGLEPGSRGHLSIRGREVPWPRSARAAIDAGIALIPEDRKQAGLIPELTAAENITLGDFGDAARYGLVSWRRLLKRARGVATEVNLDSRRLEESVRNLSGGNQQKLLVARCLLRSPRLLLADEPTRGIDVGAKTEILGHLRRLAREGTPVVVVSSELEELEAVCDRVLVLSGGRVVEELSGAEMNVDRMLHAAFEVGEPR